MPLAKISENIKNVPKNLKNISPENLGKNKEHPALGKYQRSLQDHIACKHWTVGRSENPGKNSNTRTIEEEGVGFSSLSKSGRVGTWEPSGSDGSVNIQDGLSQAQERLLST